MINTLAKLKNALPFDETNESYFRELKNREVVFIAKTVGFPILDEDNVERAWVKMKRYLDEQRRFHKEQRKVKDTNTNYIDFSGLAYNRVTDDL